MVAEQSAMSCARLGKELLKHLPQVTGERGVWHAKVNDLDVFVMADDDADRVRVMTPVARADPGDHDLLLVLLSANFDRALDAHYAVHAGVVWCLFVHRLSDLTAEQVGTSIEAVLTLARNTGTSFACGAARFTGTLGVEGGVA